MPSNMAVLTGQRDEQGSSPPRLAQVEGTLEKNHEVLDFPRIEGKWDESLTATMPDGSRRVIWKTSPPAADPTRSPPSSRVVQKMQSGARTEVRQMRFVLQAQLGEVGNDPERGYAWAEGEARPDRLQTPPRSALHGDWGVRKGVKLFATSFVVSAAFTSNVTSRV